MYEIMMYAGAAGFVIFFLLSVFLFIKNRIPSAIMYFINLRRKGIDIWSANKKQASHTTKRAEKTEFLDTSENGGMVTDPTAYLDGSVDPTVYLGGLENTELLPEYINE